MKTVDTSLVNNIMDAFECAREALAWLPPMPPNMKPVHFRVLNALYKIGGLSGSARVSDISKVSGLLLPNTTKFINEMIELNIVDKFTVATDKRVVLVRATKLGQEYIDNYVISFIEDLEKEFSRINQGDCIIMIETINKVSQAMKSVYQE